MDQIKKVFVQLKEFWGRQTKKKKTVLLSVLCGIVLVSVLLAVLLNSGGDGYVALYSGLDYSESIEVYQMLQAMSVPVKLDSSGQIFVMEQDKDMLLIQLAALGYPKSAPSYDVFTSNAGLTTTEFEKKQYLLFQLQERIAQTIKHIDGVQNAIVTLVVPEDSNYVWESSSQRSTASVLITMKNNAELSPGKISAIKSLIASAVPKMQVEDVTLVDARTSLEMGGDKDEDPTLSTNRLGFEAKIEDTLVKKVKEVLSLGYSDEEMRVAATVVIDYSRMITEQMEYRPEDNGYGVPAHLEESYITDPQSAASGIVGEEHNTDIPIYVDSDDDGVADTIYYVRDVDYFVSYVKQQIEKDNTLLVDASIAVTLMDGTMTRQKRESIVGLIANATNVSPENITVLDLLSPIEDDKSTEDVDEPVSISFWEEYRTYIILGAGALLALIILAVLITLVIRALLGKKKKSSKSKSEEELLEEELEEALRIEEEERQRKLLRDAAIASADQDNKLIAEVKEFAGENPEITASLIRLWLKEGE